MPVPDPLETSAAALRESAKQARALSEMVNSPDAKWGFAQLADKWEAQARDLDRRGESGNSDGFSKTIDLRR